MAPQWLVDKATQRRRAAHNTTCRRCGAPTLTGDNYDYCSWTITVDAEPATWTEAIHAHLTGRGSATLINGDLNDNRTHHLTTPPTHPIHLTHTCARKDT